MPTHRVGVPRGLREAVMVGVPAEAAARVPGAGAAGVPRAGAARNVRRSPAVAGRARRAEVGLQPVLPPRRRPEKPVQWRAW
ncbi:TonB-linked outer membrane protein, SusC/RagA fa mily [Mycolicibacterium canariasense]|uniref:TonB-linked outer membrane protein, SusC/RagA fa mily n=1 Tax=Mycolicibacterium canariasense TaxID=228230 RepID=A0A124E229_MYCCR|nr:hypothetical protein [Mycolicibacterium canariasense]MCV7212616.1 hypothetical protein [Mycolicibacterium canariasense]GAS95524.1 TonB-linked outer membrane protein, SusC/RagA fa mily [Mycolicibacterium canariasense]